jgi:hypothetical protein
MTWMSFGTHTTTPAALHLGRAGFDPVQLGWSRKASVTAANSGEVKMS